MAIAVVLVAGAVGAGCAYASSARPACADAVLQDWTNGSLDSKYAPECYEAAIDALPEDLRAYTTAGDDISRAAIAATRADSQGRRLTSSSAETENASAFPLTVALLSAFAAVLVAGGLVASHLRRRRAR